jgi:hypothetical protein
MARNIKYVRAWLARNGSAAAGMMMGWRRIPGAEARTKAATGAPRERVQLPSCPAILATTAFPGNGLRVR